MKVYELATKHNMKPKELLEVLSELEIQTPDGHLTDLNPKYISTIQKFLDGRRDTKKSSKKAKVKQEPVQKEEISTKTIDTNIIVRKIVEKPQKTEEKKNKSIENPEATTNEKPKIPPKEKN